MHKLRECTIFYVNEKILHKIPKGYDMYCSTNMCVRNISNDYDIIYISSNLYFFDTHLDDFISVDCPNNGFYGYCYLRKSIFSDRIYVQDEEDSMIFIDINEDDILLPEIINIKKTFFTLIYMRKKNIVDIINQNKNYDVYKNRMYNDVVIFIPNDIKSYKKNKKSK